MLDKLREKFAHGYDDFKNFIEDHADAADTAIEVVGETYEALDGHDKMTMAVGAFLSSVSIPAPIAILASQKLVDITEEFIQKRYDAKRA